MVDVPPHNMPLRYVELKPIKAEQTEEEVLTSPLTWQKGFRKGPVARRKLFPEITFHLRDLLPEGRQTFVYQIFPLLLFLRIAFLPPKPQTPTLSFAWLPVRAISLWGYRNVRNEVLFLFCLMSMYILEQPQDLEGKKGKFLLSYNLATVKGLWPAGHCLLRPDKFIILIIVMSFTGTHKFQNWQHCTFTHMQAIALLLYLDKRFHIHTSHFLKAQSCGLNCILPKSLVDALSPSTAQNVTVCGERVLREAHN